MWNAAGASLAVAMYLSCIGDHKEYSHEGCSVVVHKYGLQFGIAPGIYWNDVKELDLNKCVMPLLHCGVCEIILIPELLRDMAEWSIMQSVTYIRHECNTRILEVIEGGRNHCVIAYPCDNPVLIVTDTALSRMITKLRGAWFVREKIGFDSTGRAMKVGFNEPGTYVVYKDSISPARVIDFINDGKPEDTSEIIGEKMYDGIKNIIQSNTNWLERYKKLIWALKQLGSDLPDTLDVVLQADKETKD